MLEPEEKDSRASNSDSTANLDPLEYRPLADVDSEKLSDRAYNVYDEDSPKPLEAPNLSELSYRMYVKVWKPDWILNHTDWQSFKVAIRTFLQVWPTVIIAVVPTSANWTGNASYLPQITGFICPSGGRLVALTLVMAFACFVCCLFGWTIAVISLAITTKIRGWPTSASIAQMLIEDGSCTEENISLCVKTEIYTGRFLETRCSAIFAIGMIVGILLLGTSLKVHPMARTPFVCGAIALIINSCYSVFLPFFDPLSIGLTVLKPMGIGCAMMIIAAVLIFPSTSNFMFFSAGERVLSALKEIADKNQRFFSTMKPSKDNFTNYRSLLTDVEKVRTKLPPVEMFLLSTRIEVSYGRLSSDDAFEFSSRIKALVNTFAGYQYFYLLLQERKELISGLFESVYRRDSLPHKDSCSATGLSKVFAAFGHKYAEVGAYERNKNRRMLSEMFKGKSPDDITTLKDLDRVAKTIKQYHEGYLTCSTAGVKSISSWLCAANGFRAYSFLDRKKHIEEQRASHEELLKARGVLQDFITKHEEEWSKLSMKELEDMHGHEQALSLISQTSLFLFLSRQVSNQLLSFMDFFLQIDERTPTPKLMVSLWPLNRKKRAVSGTEEPSMYRKRDPDALAPRTWSQRIMFGAFRLYDSLLNEFAWYWLRSGFLVTLCAVPFFCRATAHFFYDHKLVWVVIMCALSTSESSAESVYVFVSKVVFSFVGAISGMIGWYISTGSGKGNYYGYSIVTAVMFFFLAYYRHFSIHLNPVPAIMISVTPTLVLGTSWVDGMYGALDTGVGWPVALTRFISVIVGLCVAMLASLIPKVKSSKVAVRKSLADALEEVNIVQSKVCEFAVKRYNDPTVHIKAVNDQLSNEVRSRLLKLAATKALMKSIRYERIVSGDWPTEKYQRLLTSITGLFQLYFLQYRLIDQMDDTRVWIPHLVKRAAWNLPGFIADTVSLTYMTSEALRLKTPLPELTNATMSLKHLEHLSFLWGTSKISLNERLYEIIEATEEKADDSHVDGRTLKLRSLDLEKLLSHDGQLSIVSLLLMHLIYERVDEATLVTKGLVGEKYDFDQQLFDM